MGQFQKKICGLCSLSAGLLLASQAIPATPTSMGRLDLPLILAQQEEFEGAENPNFNDDGSRKPEQQNANSVNPATTAFIVDFIALIEQNCRGLAPQYRVGCLSTEMRSLADRVPKRGDYADAQKALDRVAKELEKITRASRDRRQPKVAVNAQRPKGTAPERTGAITAIKTDALPKATAQATAALEKGKLTLLRSASEGGDRAQHYQQIAAAFDNSAVLLRS